MSEGGPRKICCCEQETFIKILNMAVAVAMIIIGFVNIFKIGKVVEAKTQILLYVSFIVYQM